MSEVNIKLFAIKLGDALKYTSSVNVINRIAKAVFPFSKDSFPNDSITSERAKLIFDWVSTLGINEPVNWKKLLIQFCQGITSEGDKEVVDKLLKENGIGSLYDNSEMKDFFSRGFHPEVVKHAKKLFGQRNYFHSVFEVCKAYNKRVREKSKSDKDGSSLMMSVWGCDSGVLKITKCETETDKNVQDGIKFLSSGLMRAIRNPTGHEPAIEWPISKNDCLDILSFLTFLFRKLDDAVYYKSQ